MFVIHANLDAEATWAGVALPATVRARLALTAVLLAALAPDGEDDIEIWAPAAVDPARVAYPARVTMRVGTPPRADLQWADPGARGVNSRRGTLVLARHLGLELPGARAIASLDELDTHLAAGRAAASPDRRWVCKAVHTAAGRDRAHGQGDLPPSGELRARIANLLARHGALIFEPWLDRICDAGIYAVATDDDDAPTVAPPHGLVTDARGGFAGIDVARDGLLPAERAQLVDVARTVAGMLARNDYRGPLGLDAFAYRDATGARRFHPLCEINARYTFGAVAAALARRLGRPVLGFGPPPDGAQILVAPASSDRFAAWVSGLLLSNPSG